MGINERGGQYRPSRPLEEPARRRHDNEPSVGEDPPLAAPVERRGIARHRRWNGQVGTRAAPALPAIAAERARAVPGEQPGIGQDEYDGNLSRQRPDLT